MEVNVTFKRSGCWIWILIFGVLHAQLPETSTESREQEKSSIGPVDFTDFSKIYKSSREEFETWKRERNLTLNQKAAQYQALEQAIDSEKYIVGPGDVFSLNVWGPIEQHIPVTVSPEGKLIIPSIGEIECIDQTLKTVQTLVLAKVFTFYSNCQIDFPLITPRSFMVHVTGEVKYPGTYQANGATRVSELLFQAGGISKVAWKQGIQIKQVHLKTDTIDIDAFETLGDLEQNPYVSGGDVIFVPAMDPNSSSLICVEGNIEHSGIYQILPGERLKDFLFRIRVFNTQTKLSSICVIRSRMVDSHPRETTTYPFTESNGDDFKLESGDRVVLPSNYVFVKGSVINPGAYAFTQNLKAKDYAVMARWTGSLESVRVLHVQSGKKEKGPEVLIQPGDIVDVPKTWGQKLGTSFEIVTTLTSLILTAVAVGVL